MQLDLDVWRTRESRNSVMGELWIHGRRWLYTLEPSRLTPCHPGHPCISAGRYRAVLTRSLHLGYICPELLDVPERSNIRIHVANWPMDLLGCTAVGEIEDTDYVGDSQLGFNRLMQVLPHYEPIWITYHDAKQPVTKVKNDYGSAGNGRAEAARAASADHL